MPGNTAEMNKTRAPKAVEENKSEFATPDVSELRSQDLKKLMREGLPEGSADLDACRALDEFAIKEAWAKDLLETLGCMRKELDKMECELKGQDANEGA